MKEIEWNEIDNSNFVYKNFLKRQNLIINEWMNENEMKENEFPPKFLNWKTNNMKLTFLWKKK